MFTVAVLAGEADPGFFESSLVDVDVAEKHTGAEADQHLHTDESEDGQGRQVMMTVRRVDRRPGRGEAVAVIYPR